MTLSFSMPRGPLLKAVQLCAKVVQKRNTIKILSNVAIRSEEDGGLLITGTDLDVEATIRIPASAVNLTSAGDTTVSAGLLSDILKRSAEGAEIRFAEQANGRATVHAGKAAFKLLTLPLSDFPDFPGTIYQARLALDPSVLRRIVAEVSFAISEDEVRYFLNGVFLHTPLVDGVATLTAVATDGHRLSRSHLVAYEGEGDMPGIIVPKKTISLLETIADSCEADELVEIEVNESRIVFHAGLLRISSKLIDGTFPDYNRVIPTGNDKRYSLDLQALFSTIGRVQTISSERGRAARFAFGKSSLDITVSDPDQGEAREELASKSEGDGAEDGIQIGFSSKYAIDALATFGGDVITFSLADPGSPSLITDPADPKRTIVLMPMRV